MRAVLDRVIAAVGAVASAPVVAVVAFLVRRQDGGPGLIKVDRVGRHGTVFGMWKIRSMRIMSDDGLAGGVALTTVQDDRITPVGRWIRALHLDELPQLYNVLAGDMALLGPRPEAPDWVEDGPAWREVLTVRPGIAGPTQLIVAEWERESIGAADDGSAYVSEVLPVKLAIDAWYVRSASPGLDLLVVSSLVERVALRRRARRLEREIADRVGPASLPIAWLDAHFSR